MAAAAETISIIARLVDEVSAPAARAKEALRGVGSGSKDAAADVSKAGKAIQDTGTHLDTVGAKAKSFGGLIKGAVAGIAALGAVKVARDFANDSVKAFEATGNAAIKMQRSIGGSIEDASRVNAVFKALGLDGDEATAMMGKLSKTLASSSGPAKALGVELRNTQGQMRPMSELLPDLAEKFKSMPDGPEKTAAAMQLFGRQGQQMLPFLNQGKAGIAGLIEASDRYGTTISGDQVAAIKKAKAAQREWNMANEGLKVQIGAQLLPLMTMLSLWIKDKVIPAIGQASAWIKAHKEEIKDWGAKLMAIGPWIAGAVVAFTAFTKIGHTITAVKLALDGFKQAQVLVTAAQWLWNAATSANPLVLLGIAIAAVVAALVYFFTQTETGRKAWAAFTSALASGWEWFVGALSAGKDKIGEAWSWLTQQASALKDGIGERVNGIVRFFTDLPGNIVRGLSGLKDRLWAAIVQPISDIAGEALDKLSVIPGVGSTIGLARQVASGVGDTSSSVAGGGNIRNTLAGFGAVGASGLGISNIWIGGGGKGRGSGDHQAGRALDLVGSPGRMSAFIGRARALGDFAELHGSGSGQHVHYVPRNDYAGHLVGAVRMAPGGVGDTSASMAGGLYVAPGAIVVSGAGDPAAVADAVMARIERRYANARERR